MKVHTCLSIFIACAITVALPVAAPSLDQAKAAVRICKAHVTSKLTSADSERDAKRAAIMDWTEKAKAAGFEHPNWRIAGYKVVKCVPRAGRFECLAHAAPCTIRQKAPHRRKELKPKSPDAGSRAI
ncbi:MAG: hypothetical protein KJ587_04025 [Alphaproteobacteria bacterium]|nr:hypothetical protein [Alphaproteobacteria bacterium]